MAERNPDVQDLTASEPSAAGTDVHVVKKRGILGFLNKGINKDADDDTEGGESEGSELIADDQEVGMALDAAWMATLQVVGLAAGAGGADAEVEAVGEGVATEAADAGDESDPDALLGLGLD
jgi:hypothetical protein